MKLNKLILPVACILLAGNVSMAQIMPWENRTETDGDPFAKGETTATKGTGAFVVASGDLGELMPKNCAQIQIWLSEHHASNHR